MIQFASDSNRQNTPSTSLARQIGLFLIGLLLICGISPTEAEQLKTPIMQQGGKNATAMPSHGQTQAAVKARFGEPQTVKGPVGDPPITQWYYPRFVVYFEYSHVIHSVAKPNH